MMETASYHATNQVSQLKAPSTESIRASVAQLLSQAHNLPCSKAAHAFSQLLPHVSRFQLALDALLPSLDEGNEVCGCSYPSPPQFSSLVAYFRQPIESFRVISYFRCMPLILYPSTHSRPSCTPFSYERPTGRSRWRRAGVSPRMINSFMFFGRFSRVMERTCVTVIPLSNPPNHSTPVDSRSDHSPLSIS